MEAFKQKTVGCLMSAGCAVFCISFVLLWVFGVAGVFRGTYTRTPVTNDITDAGTLNWTPLMITFMVFGILMMLGGLGYGLWTVANERKGPRKTIENFHVLARYAYDKEGNYMMDDHQMEHSQDVRCYVRGHAPNAEMLEYETTEEVWRQCGEGMYGEAAIQGKWIGRFVPYVGGPDPSAENPPQFR